MSAALPKIRAVRARAVSVPMRRPLVVATGTVERAHLVLVDVETDAAATGRAYSFAFSAAAAKPIADLVAAMGAMILGDALAPYDLERKLVQRFTLLGTTGLVGMALAGLDMAAWDAAARLAGLPLARLLGAAPRPIPAYNSNGLGLIGPAQAAVEAQALLAEGFTAIKLRLGYPALERDLATAAAVRRAIGAAPILMTDYNQALVPAEAIRRGRALDGLGLAWIEEPVAAADHAGNAAVAAALHTPVQIGENFWGPADMGRALAAGACDYCMPDAMKIGGVSGWLRAAALAEARAMPMSSHLFPEFSAHLLAATPTAHWLEYVDWAAPVLAEPLTVSAGHVMAPGRPGAGLDWNEAAVARYLTGEASARA